MLKNKLKNYHIILASGSPRRQQLMKDLEANPNDERVVNALIRHYQLKLEVMDQIITQLNQVKSEISENYEKESNLKCLFVGISFHKKQLCS